MSGVANDRALPSVGAQRNNTFNQHKSGVPPPSSSVRHIAGLESKAQKAPRGTSNKTSASQLPLSSIDQNNFDEEEEEQIMGLNKGVSSSTRSNPFSHQ